MGAFPVCPDSQSLPFSRGKAFFHSREKAKTVAVNDQKMVPACLIHRFGQAGNAPSLLAIQGFSYALNNLVYIHYL